MNTKILVLPGIGNSGPQHWQTIWENTYPNFQRVQQRDWDNPVCAEWVATLEKTVGSSGHDVILVAHSLACLLVAHWAAATRYKIKAAFLAAVPNPSGPNFPKEAVGFSPVPFDKFPFQSLVVASSNDPYGSEEFTHRCASSWGSRFENIGAVGHINTSSDLGKWPQGLSLLQSLVAQSGAAGDAAAKRSCA
jgi:uncharacterized protein